MLPIAMVATLAETCFMLLVLRWPRRETRGLLCLFLPAQAVAWLAPAAFVDGLQRHDLTITDLGAIAVEGIVVVLDYVVLRLFALLQSRKRTGEPISIGDAATLAVAGNFVAMTAAIANAALGPVIWTLILRRHYLEWPHEGWLAVVVMVVVVEYSALSLLDARSVGSHRSDRGRSGTPR